METCVSKEQEEEGVTKERRSAVTCPFSWLVLRVPPYIPPPTLLPVVSCVLTITQWLMASKEKAGHQMVQGMFHASKQAENSTPSSCQLQKDRVRDPSYSNVRPYLFPKGMRKSFWKAFFFYLSGNKIELIGPKRVLVFCF